MQGDRYSQMVAWLKVALPIMALAILSTLFLLSRATDPTSSIPFADADVQNRLANQKITGPYFSGTTADGDLIAFVAEEVTSPQELVGETRAKDVFVRIDMAGGTAVTVKSDTASVLLADDQADLTGNVILVSSQGYEVRSQFLTARVTALDVRSPETVSAITPAGDLVAGAMHLRAGRNDANAQMVFTNGVKLLYQPKEVED
ncbi:LPS export ABC transporter periplasmic protein LptC [Roseobacter sp. S98]|uniref:LPS export ABC transporter periplasmic protein LptC n=1 Tax=Roseobacter algicola (ex Choi et al. 2025) (nom. illeg.) TaxID=3092138 RepID=UPI0035C669AD